MEYDPGTPTLQPDNGSAIHQNRLLLVRTMVWKSRDDQIAYNLRDSFRDNLRFSSKREKPLIHWRSVPRYLASGVVVVS
jgi:hypothetical protein